MKFSVIIPLYNRENYIERAIGSVISQTHQEFEILVVNDGSSDRSAAVVAQIGDSRIRLINQANKGPAAARNTGIRNARYDWIAFLDSDDEWLPIHLAEAGRTLRQHADLRWYFAGYSIRTNDGHTLEDHVWQDHSGCLEDFFASMLSFHFTLPTAGVVHKSVFAEVGDFSPGLGRGEDLEMWFRIALKFPAVGYSPNVTVVYYKTEDAITATNIGEHAPHWLKMLQVISEDARGESQISRGAKRLFERWVLSTANLAEFEMNYSVIRELLGLKFKTSLRTRVMVRFYLMASPLPGVCRYLLKVWRDGPF